MKRLLVITQKVDDDDDLLGFFGSWLSALSPHFARIDVITMGVGRHNLPQNIHVHSLGKEAGVSKPAQAFRLLRLLWRLSPGCSSIFAHMSPIFAVIAWPFARINGCRLVLWYLHRSVTFKLRLALLLSDTIVTADASSLRLKSPKIVAVGHGIDVSNFATARDWSVVQTRPLRLIGVGRISPIKDFATLIRSAASLRDSGFDVQVRIIGRPVMPGDDGYYSELQELVTKLSLQDTVHFFGFVPYSQMTEQYRWADVVVGCTPSGGIDKTLLEGMAAGCIALTSNAVMGPYLRPYTDSLIFRHGDWEDLAAKLSLLSDMEAISRAMTMSVSENHSLPVLAGRLAGLL